MGVNQILTNHTSFNQSDSVIKCQTCDVIGWKKCRWSKFHHSIVHFTLLNNLGLWSWLLNCFYISTEGAHNKNSGELCKYSYDYQAKGREWTPSNPNPRSNERLRAGYLLIHTYFTVCLMSLRLSSSNLWVHKVSPLGTSKKTSLSTVLITFLFFQRKSWLAWGLIFRYQTGNLNFIHECAAYEGP